MGKGADFVSGEVVDKEGCGGIPVVGCFIARGQVRDTYIVRLGDFRHCSEESFSNTVVVLYVVHIIAESNGKEFPIGVVLPFDDQVDVDEVQCGHGVHNVDFGHVALGILVKWVTGGVLGQLFLSFLLFSRSEAVF